MYIAACCYTIGLCINIRMLFTIHFSMVVVTEIACDAIQIVQCLSLCMVHRKLTDEADKYLLCDILRSIIPLHFTIGEGVDRRVEITDKCIQCLLIAFFYFVNDLLFSHMPPPHLLNDFIE